MGFMLPVGEFISQNLALNQLQLTGSVSVNVTSKTIQLFVKGRFDVINEVDVRILRHQSKIMDSTLGVITLEELVRHTGVTHEQLEQECDDVLLDDIAEHIVSYLKYGPKLGLSAADITAFQQNLRIADNAKLITAEVFKEWHKRRSFLATYRVLAEVALEVGDGTGATKICEICAKDSYVNKIHNETDYSKTDCSNAYYTMVRCSVSLNHAMSKDPKALALALYSVGFISQATLNETNELNETKSAKGSRLYSAVLDRVRSFPMKFVDFIDILRQDRLQYGDVLMEIERTFFSDSTTSSDDTDSEKVKKVPESIPAGPLAFKRGNDNIHCEDCESCKNDLCPCFKDKIFCDMVRCHCKLLEEGRCDNSNC